MGITYNSAKYLKWIHEKGFVDFSNTAMLGRQEYYITGHNRKKLRESVPEFKDVFHTDYSEPMFAALGAHDIHSIDISDYEGADIICNMNMPVCENLKNRFTCVFDGGATEHIFNYPVAINNIMQMLCIGGVYIGIVPSDHQNGHGFYQFGPMIFMQLFCKQNGFRLLDISFSNDTEGRTIWNLKKTQRKQRIEITSRKPMFIYVAAKKIAKKEEIFDINEGFYEDAWNCVERFSRKRFASQSPFVRELLCGIRQIYYKVKRNYESQRSLYKMCEKVLL